MVKIDKATIKEQTGILKIKKLLRWMREMLPLDYKLNFQSGINTHIINQFSEAQTQ